MTNLNKPQPKTQPGGQASKQLSEQASSHLNEKANKQSSAQLNEQTGGRVNRQPSERSTNQFSEQSTNHFATQSTTYSKMQLDETTKILAADLAEIASQAVLSVADYLRAAVRTTPEYATKSNHHDPVTIHDRHVEHLLQIFLGKAIPGSRILGEENGEQILNAGSTPISTLVTAPNFLDSTNAPETPIDTSRVANLKERVRWIVDPIDGTANFASGLTYFGTSVGVELDGRIVAGAISVPYTHELFAANTTTAWHIDQHGKKTILHANGATSEEKALISCYYPKTYFWDKYPQMALRHDLALHRAYFVNRTLGAGAIDLALVAAGWIGVTVGISFKPWDVAAGIHLIRVAGGTVLNLDYNTNLPDGLRPVVVASGSNLQAETAEKIILEAIKTDWPDLPEAQTKSGE